MRASKIREIVAYSMLTVGLIIMATSPLLALLYFNAPAQFVVEMVFSFLLWGLLISIIGYILSTEVS